MGAEVVAAWRRMGGLRQRRKGGSGDPGDGGLSEPLLGGSGSEPGSSPRVVGGAESVERDGDGDERGAGGGGFDLLGAIVDFFVSVFASMGLCSRPPPPLSDVQRLRLSKLAARAAVPYNPRSDAHVDALRELWRLTFPGRALPGLQCDEWKEMGWQVSRTQRRHCVAAIASRHAGGSRARSLLFPFLG